MENKVKPIRITDPETNETYVLEFSKESVKFAEERRFNISELLDYPILNIPALWFYAFRKNHKNLAKNQTDKLLEKLGGLNKDLITRLVQLYNEPANSLIITEDDGGSKNSNLTVEL